MYKFVIHWVAGEGMKASRVVFRHETAKNVGNCKFSKLFELQIRLLFQLSRCSCRGPWIQTNFSKIWVSKSTAGMRASEDVRCSEGRTLKLPLQTKFVGEADTGGQPQNFLWDFVNPTQNCCPSCPTSKETLSLHYEGRLKVKCTQYEGHFTLRWRSARVSQEFQPKTWLFEARDGMLEKMRRQ